MKKLLSGLLALVLSLSLSAPALAEDGFADLDPPLWQVLHFGSLAEYMEAESLSAEGYIEMVTWMEAYLAAHPEEDAGFDADAFYDEELWGTPVPGFPRETWIGRMNDDLPGGYTEEDFYSEMRAEWLLDLWHSHQDRVHQDALVTLYPDDFAVFDADAWFAGYYGGHVGVTKEGYMGREGLADEEDFRRAMFADCADGTYRMGNWTVAVNGTPVDFYPREEAFPTLRAGSPREGEADILWVPARAVGEALGYGVDYDAPTGQVTFTRAGRSAVFTVDSAQYTVNGRALALDAPACAGHDRLYLPIPQLAEALGCTWNWNGPRSAVFLQSAEESGPPGSAAPTDPNGD